MKKEASFQEELSSIACINADTNNTGRCPVWEKHLQTQQAQCDRMRGESLVGKVGTMHFSRLIANILGYFLPSTRSMQGRNAHSRLGGMPSQARSQFEVRFRVHIWNGA